MSGDFSRVIAGIIAALNSGNLEQVDEAFHPEAIIHLPVGDFGPAGYKAYVNELLKGLPDASFQELETFTAGESGCSRILMSGTLTGEQGIFPCESNGQVVRHPYVVVGHTKDGKCTEAWLVSDRLALMQQLGVIPAAP